MGRAFEFRKERKFKRWAKMAVQFTRLGKEIAMAVKAGGGNPETNSRLRTAIQNAKGVNMPKDRIESAIKRASSRDEKDYEEIVYEGYGPYGVAILIETATENINRTVGNIRSYFSKHDGSLGKTGSLDFIFTRKSIFKIRDQNFDADELELELIDFGLEELYIENEGEISIQCAFEDFGLMQKVLEEKNCDIISAKPERIAQSHVAVTEAQAEEILKLLDRFEEDDDVQAVYHNMAE